MSPRAWNQLMHALNKSSVVVAAPPNNELCDGDDKTWMVARRLQLIELEDSARVVGHFIVHNVIQHANHFGREPLQVFGKVKFAQQHDTVDNLQTVPSSTVVQLQPIDTQDNIV